MVAAGSHHVALLLQNGFVYTCGVGSSGRLGQHPNEFGASCYDTNHPLLVDSLKVWKNLFRSVQPVFSFEALILHLSFVACKRPADCMLIFAQRSS